MCRRGPDAVTSRCDVDEALSAATADVSIRDNHKRNFAGNNSVWRISGDMVSADSVRSIKLRSRPQRRNSKLQNQIESLVPKAARRVENEDRFWVIEGVEDEIVKVSDGLRPHAAGGRVD